MGSVASVGRWWWTSRLWWRLLLLIASPILVVSATTKVSSTILIEIVVVVVSVVIVVIIIVVVVIIVVHGPPIWVHSSARWRWNKAGPNPAAFSRFLIVIKGNVGALVHVFLPSVWEGWNPWIVLAHGSNVGLLGPCQSHFPLLPLHDVFLVVQLEVFPKLPSSPLLFAAGGAVVCQIRIGVVVKEARHCGCCVGIVATVVSFSVQ